MAQNFKDISGYLVAFILGAILSGWYFWPEPKDDIIQDLENQVHMYEVERDSLIKEIHKMDYTILTLYDSISVRDSQIENIKNKRMQDKKHYEKLLKDIDLIPDDSLQSEFDRLYPSGTNQ